MPRRRSPGSRKQGRSLKTSAFKCCKRHSVPRAAAQSQIQRHVAQAWFCFQAAPPNAQCVQAVCHQARGLTLQSRGQTTAGQVSALLPAHSRRCLPLISNVGRHECRQALQWYLFAVPLHYEAEAPTHTRTCFHAPNQRKCPVEGHRSVIQGDRGRNQRARR